MTQKTTLNLLKPPSGATNGQVPTVQDGKFVLAAAGAGAQGPKGDTGATGATGATGPQGSTGAAGTNGTNGTNGQGVPTGGTTGQILAKTSATDYATAWATDLAGNAGSATRLQTSRTITVAGDGSGSAVFDGTANATINITVVKTLHVFCGGVFTANQIVGGGIAPYAVTFNSANCQARLDTAPAAALTFVIRKNGTQVGTASFNAGATLGTVSFTNGSFAQNDFLTVLAPAIADTAAANLTLMLRN